MDWKASSPLKQESFKNYESYKATLLDAMNSTLLNNPFNAMNSTPLNNPGAKQKFSLQPNFNAYFQADSISSSKINLPMSETTSFGTINFTAHLVSVQSDIAPITAPTQEIYKVYPVGQSPFIMEVSHEKGIGYECPNSDTNSNSTTSYSMKPHVLNPEAEEYIPKMMRDQQNSTSSTDSAPYFDDWGHLIAATQFLISNRDKMSNKERVEESQKFNPNRSFAQEEMYPNGFDSKLVVKIRVGIGEESSKETSVESQELGLLSSNECKCDNENRETDSSLGPFLSQPATPIDLSVLKSLGLSDSESRYSSNENKEPQNLTTEMLEDELNENNRSCNKEQIPDSKNMVFESVFTNGVHEKENSLSNSSNDKIADESDSDSSDDEVDVTNIAEDSDSDDSICFECGSDEGDDDEEEEEEDDDEEEEDDDDEEEEKDDDEVDDIGFENADNLDDSICFEDKDESICFVKADNTDDSICFEDTDESMVKADNTDDSICFENENADKNADSKEDGEKEEDDFTICFECNGTQGDESVASDSFYDEEDGDCDYNCDLFEVEFNDSEWDLPMGGLVISNIVFQGSCSLDNRSNNHGDSEAVNGNNCFDTVDCSLLDILGMEIREANKKWNKEIVKNCCCSTPQKVTFSDEVEVHSADDWSRKGPWEECARDRMRFRRRIDETEAILSSVLTPEHRNQVLMRRD